MAVLLKDIAQKAGCSIAVVSSVLNNQVDGNIRCSEEVAESIMAAADELGYQPKRKKKRVRQDEIAVVFPLYGTDFYLNTSGLIKEFEAQIARYGYRTQYLFATEIGYEKQLDELVKGGTVAGMIVIAADDFGCWDQYSSDIPIVHINPSKEFEQNCILLDDAQGTRQALKFIWACGFKKLLYLDFQCNHYSQDVRKNTALAEAEKLGIETSVLLTSEHFPEKKFSKLVKGREGLCIAAYSGKVALDAMRVLWDFGMRVPEDIGVVSLSGEPSMSQFYPLTYARLPFDEIGRCAADCITNMITRKVTSFTSRKVSEFLVIGETCRVITGN